MPAVAAPPAQSHTHALAVGQAGAKPKFDGQCDHHTPKPYVRQAFRKCLECGIFAHGFARAWCDDCGHDYFVVYSCKGRGVCPSCSTRRVVETTAHLTDHVFPRLPVHQWVFSVPKRLRYFIQRDEAVLNMVLRIFLRVIAQSLQSNCPGAAQVDRAALYVGAVALAKPQVHIHRFGSSLNGHVHFHVCVVDGVFERVADSVIFHPAAGIDADAVAQAQATLRRRILRAFVGWGHLERFEAKEMLAYKHSGFSVDAGVCVEAQDRAGLERLLRYGARPPFSTDRLRKAGSELVYRCAKQYSEPGSDKRGAKADELQLTPLELIDRIAAVTAMDAAPAQRATAKPKSTAQPVAMGEGADGPAPLGNAIAPTPEPVPPKRPVHYLWAVLIARINEVFPLLCPICGGKKRIIAFIIHSANIRQILDHIGADSEPPHIDPARGSTLWGACNAWAGEGSQIGQNSGLVAQPVSGYEVGQRINW